MKKRREKERVRKDIAEGFAFVRYLVKNPAMLKKIKDNSEIRIIPSEAGRALSPKRIPRNVSVFRAETVFRRVSGH